MKKTLVSALALLALLSTSVAFSENQSVAAELEAVSDSTPAVAQNCLGGFDISGSYFNRDLREKADKATAEVLNQNGFAIETEGAVDFLLEIDLCGKGVHSDCDLVVKNMLGGGSYQSVVKDIRNLSNDEIIAELKSSIAAFKTQCE